MAGIFVLSSIPGYARPEDWALAWLVAKTPPLIQKTLHVLLYGGLACLLFWTLAPLPIRFRALAAFMIAVSFGAFNEWHQLQMPGRVGSITDVMLNAAGAALGLLIAILN